MAEIVVDDAAISALSTKFEEFRQTVETMVTDLGKLDPLLPGDFDLGRELGSVFLGRKGDLVTALNHLKDALAHIHTRLGEIAADYKATANDAEITVTELDKMVTDLQSDLDGIVIVKG